MAFDDIHPVTSRLQTATADEIAAAEKVVGAPFPPGYAEFVARFGDGSISNWVRVYPPARVAEEFPGLRERREEYFFWDDGADVLSREQVAASILLADTYNGDELVYHPAEPAGLFVLPQDDGAIHSVGGSLGEAIEWLCTSGELTGPIFFKFFEPTEGRELRRFEAENDGPTFEDVRDGLLTLGMHEYANDSTEGDDKCFDLLYAEFGGRVTIVEGPNGAIVGVRLDEGADGPKLDDVLAKLQEFGLSQTD